MAGRLYYNTVAPLLLDTLKILMESERFDAFRLVGGTALSLQRGHRKSMDIDLFTDALYDTVNYEAIEAFLYKSFSYVDSNKYEAFGVGKSYFIGKSEEDCVKLDLFYTDKFIQDTILVDGIRMAAVEDIIAMKIDVILRGGRKKDFWDIHELMEEYSMEKMLALHEQRNPYTHDEEQIRRNFSNFLDADGDFEPICLKEKHWEIIKLDMIDFAKKS